MIKEEVTRKIVMNDKAIPSIVERLRRYPFLSFALFSPPLQSALIRIHFTLPFFSFLLKLMQIVTLVRIKLVHMNGGYDN